MNLNLGSGTSKFDGYISVDVNPSVKPQVVADVRALPFKTESVSTVLLLHTIEHIEKKFHIFLFTEIHRVLESEGKFVLVFPEFKQCVQNWLDNKLGKRDFWEATIYGRQASKDDFHVCAMYTDEVLELLQELGFKNLVAKPEIEAFNTVIIGFKGTPLPTYEEMIR